MEMVLRLPMTAFEISMPFNSNGKAILCNIEKNLFGMAIVDPLT